LDEWKDILLFADTHPFVTLSGSISLDLYQTNAIAAAAAWKRKKKKKKSQGINGIGTTICLDMPSLTNLELFYIDDVGFGTLMD